MYAHFVGFCSLGRLAGPCSIRIVCRWLLPDLDHILDQRVCSWSHAERRHHAATARQGKTWSAGTKSPNAVEPCRRGPGSNRYDRTFTTLSHEGYVVHQSKNLAAHVSVGQNPNASATLCLLPPAADMPPHSLWAVRSCPFRPAAPLM